MATMILAHRLLSLPFGAADAAGAAVAIAAVYLATTFLDYVEPTLLDPERLSDALDALPARLLIIRSRGDEAIAALGFGYLVGWAVRRLWFGAAQLVSESSSESFKRWFGKFRYNTPGAVVVQTVAAFIILAIGLPIPFAMEYHEWLKSMDGVAGRDPDGHGPPSLLWFCSLVAYLLVKPLQMASYVILHPATRCGRDAVRTRADLVLSLLRYQRGTDTCRTALGAGARGRSRRSEPQHLRSSEMSEGDRRVDLRTTPREASAPPRS